MGLPAPSKMGGIALFYYNESSTQVRLVSKSRKSHSGLRFTTVGGVTPKRFDEWLQGINRLSRAFTLIPIPGHPDTRFYVPTEHAGTYTPDIAKTIVESSQEK